MPQDGIRMQDGQMDFSGGINSQVVTTIASPRNPNGLKRNQSAWMTNATCRGGALWPRTGWNFLCKLFDASGKWQMGYMYEPDFSNPYLICQISGQLIQVRVDTNNAVINLSNQFNLFQPVTPDRGYFCQGEQFLFSQAGDYGSVTVPTLPLIWDGSKLFRSIGITNTAVAPGTPGVNQLPAATAMVYYQNRLWYAQGRTYSAGDMVRGTSGTLAYTFRDSIFNITENPLVTGGDGFTVPTNAGNIRALGYTANLDTNLGQGPLYIFTRKQIYQMIVPVTRADWIGANNTNQPAQSVVQITNGSVNDTSLVGVNGDLYFQSLEPGIRSLFSAIRYYQQPGQVTISRNEDRLLQFNNRALLHYSSGIEFDNRLLETAIPTQLGQNVIHQAMVPLDFDIVSSLENQLPPVWEGDYEGLQVLQLFTSDFGGLQRAFAAVVSQLDGSIELWEITDFQQSDVNTSGESRITWIIETPAYTFGDEDQFKELDNAAFWFDRIFGTVEFKLQYREDSNPCWIDWYQWQVCAPRTSQEGGGPSYPIVQYCEQDMNPMVVPKAPAFGCKGLDKRPHNYGYQFQLRFVIHGFCRLREIKLWAFPKERPHYQGLIQPVTTTDSFIVPQ